jgi:Zn-dependent protease
MPSGWWIGDLVQNGQYALLGAWIFWVVVSICLHELGHGVAAIWQGDETPRRYGHMTWNPLVHMGGWSLLCFALVGFAWGAMPVDPGRFRWGRRGRIVVAGAGPLVNLLLAIPLIVAAGVYLASFGGTDAMTPQQFNTFQFLLTGGWLNLALCLFNLLPIPPLDGSQMLAGTTFTLYRLFTSQQAMMYGQFILIALLISGAAGLVFRFSRNLSGTMMIEVAQFSSRVFFGGP